MRLLRPFPVFVFAAVPIVVGSLLVRSQSTTETAAYLDPHQPVDRRIEDLLGRMTLKEKIGQLNLPCVYVSDLGNDIPSKLQACRRFAAGTYTSEIGPGSGFFTLADNILEEGTLQQANYFNELQKIALTQTRLKIPLLEDEEGTHGAMFAGATIFPEGLAIGSTFDPDLTKSVYSAAAQEARAVGIHLLSTLVMELDRDPRMGRNAEAYSEDPFLYSKLAESIVQGAQGNDVSSPDKVGAVLTDFPTQSEPVSGLERGAIELSERMLREDFLSPWRAGITRSGAMGVMAGYPESDDEPAHASQKWLTEVLRQELGFDGVVESEGYGFQTLIDEGIVPTQKEAGALALQAGVDLNITYEPAYMGPLVQNVEEGRVPVSLVDRSVRRLLREKFRLGLFEHPYVDPNQAVRIVHSQEHQDLALAVAREGIVLLKNEQNLLPLKKNLKSIAVIGPEADSSSNQLGDYTTRKVLQPVVTVLRGIKEKVGPQTKVYYAKGSNVLGDDKSGFQDAVHAAKSADLAVVVIGEQFGRNETNQKDRSATDGEGSDVASLDLTGVQEDLVEAVSATGTPVVVVLINGRPLSVRWEAAHVQALVEAWEPGELGGTAVADVLFGDYNPSGRLAITIPRSAAQLPAYYDCKPSKVFWVEKGWSRNHGYVDMPASPLYPFGYGLSYTQFQYSNLVVDTPEIRPGANAQVHVQVKNVGSRPGVETAQLYLHERFAPVATAIKQLHGFQRVALDAGESKTVSFTLTPDDLMLLGLDMHWSVVPGTFDIMVGGSSADVPLTAALEV